MLRNTCKCLNFQPTTNQSNVPTTIKAPVESERANQIQVSKNKKQIHSKEKQQTTCKICLKPFSRIGDLNTHMKTHTCEICFKSFFQIANLKRHMKTHTGQRPYTCKICLKSFSQIANLKGHMKNTYW